MSVLGQDLGYTVKYNPLPSRVPSGFALGNSFRQKVIFDRISLVLPNTDTIWVYITPNDPIWDQINQYNLRWSHMTPLDHNANDPIFPCLTLGAVLCLTSVLGNGATPSLVAWYCTLLAALIWLSDCLIFCLTVWLSDCLTVWLSVILSCCHTVWVPLS